MLRLLVFWLFVTALAYSDGSTLQVVATLPKGVPREEAELGVFFDGSPTQVSCPLVGASGSDPLFFCDVKPGEHTARFQFLLPGYKPYSVNVPTLKVTESFIELNLGVLHPQDSDEPRIENIVLTRSNDGGSRFQISVNNLSKAQILVTSLKIDASEDLVCGVGHTPPLVFKVSDKLTLLPSTSGRAGVRGTISDSADHPEFPAQITGTGVFHVCGHNEVNLTAQMNFTIPALDYYEIELIIPSARSHRKPSDYTSSSPVSIATSDAIARFRRIHFSLFTSDKARPTITSYYAREY
jgi:hypothetical protein